MERKKLEVGDRVYATQYSQIVAIHKIVSVTEVSATSNHGQKFKRGYISTIDTTAREKYKPFYYYIETPELKAMLARQNWLHEIKNADFQKLSDEQIAAIRAIIKTI